VLSCVVCGVSFVLALLQHRDEQRLIATHLKTQVIAHEALASLPAHGYFVYYAAPGELTLAQHTEASTSVTLDVKAGETYYAKGSMGMGFFVGHPHLLIVSKDAGESEIKDCKLAPGTIPSAETVAAGPPAPAGKAPAATASYKIARAPPCRTRRDPYCAFCARPKRS
jgi:hypothetical protein